VPHAELVGDLRIKDASDSCRGLPLELHIASANAEASTLAAPNPGIFALPCARSPSLFLLDRNADGLTLFCKERRSTSLPTEKRPLRRLAFWQRRTRYDFALQMGRWAALAASDRVLLYNNSTKKGAIWQPETRVTLSGCTVADDAQSVACVLEKGAVLLAPYFILSPAVTAVLAKPANRDYSLRQCSRFANAGEELPSHDHHDRTSCSKVKEIAAPSRSTAKAFGCVLLAEAVRASLTISI